MASGVKWIKITTDIFDDEKILMIENMPSADSIIVVWFKLLTLAGKQNNDGVFLMSNRIAYTDEMLASIFRRDLNTVRLALSTFQKFGMIEIIDDVITIPNWNKHQTLDSYEKKKERDRLYMNARRAKQKALISQSSDKSSDSKSDKSSDSRHESSFQNKTKNKTEEQEYTTPISPSKGTVVSWQVHCKDNKAGNVAVNDNLAESSVISDDLVDYINDELKKPDLMQERFEQFWKLYPKKVGKGDARKKFLKLKPNQKLFDQILSAVEAAKKTEQWTKNNGQFVPNPATWLNQNRWEDDYSGSMATNSANLDYGEENEYMPF